MPEYCRPVAAFIGMASGAFAAAVPQGWTLLPLNCFRLS
jgi:hypothetical protein